MPGELLTAGAGMMGRRPAALVEIGDDRDAGKMRDPARPGAVTAPEVVGARARSLRPAERLREGEEILIPEILIPEQEHEVVGPSPFECAAFLFPERGRKVDAAYFGPEGPAGRDCSDRHHVLRIAIQAACRRRNAPRGSRHFAHS